MKRRLANYLLKNVFNAITEDDVLPWGEMTLAEKKMLIAEARMIKNSLLWKRIITQTKLRAQKQMFEGSKSWEDMFFGKATLYVIDLIDKRIKKISD